MAARTDCSSQQGLIDVAEGNSLGREVLQDGVVTPTEVTNFHCEWILAEHPDQLFKMPTVLLGVFEGNWELHQQSAKASFRSNCIVPFLRHALVFGIETNGGGGCRLDYRNRRMGECFV